MAVLGNKESVSVDEAATYVKQVVGAVGQEWLQQVGNNPSAAKVELNQLATADERRGRNFSLQMGQNRMGIAIIPGKFLAPPKIMVSSPDGSTTYNMGRARNGAVTTRRVPDTWRLPKGPAVRLPEDLRAIAVTELKEPNNKPSDPGASAAPRVAATTTIKPVAPAASAPVVIPVKRYAGTKLVWEKPSREGTAGTGRRAESEWIAGVQVQSDQLKCLEPRGQGKPPKPRTGPGMN